MITIARDVILARLAALEHEHGIRILLAVESGSRAWGFASTDSDHDVRFVYVHPVKRYLSVEPLADTMEPEAVVDGFDIGGWDIRKALWLLLSRSNATPLEWATSPVRYREKGGLADGLTQLGEQVVRRDALAYHYRQTARRAWGAALGAMPGPVPLKPLCYALRTALAVTWLEQVPTLPPMSLQALLAGAWVDDRVRMAAQELVALKAEGNERATGPCDPALAALIQAQLAVAQPRPPAIWPNAQAIAAADGLLSRMLAACP